MTVWIEDHWRAHIRVDAIERVFVGTADNSFDPDHMHAVCCENLRGQAFDLSENLTRLEAARIYQQLMEELSRKESGIIRYVDWAWLDEEGDES